MPELPDITVYIDHLRRRILDSRLERIRIVHPFFLRSVEVPVEDVQGKRVREIRRFGKRIAIGLEEEYWLVLHLMIAGRLRWSESSSLPSRKIALAAFDFTPGTLQITEASSKKRASLHIVMGVRQLEQFDRGALEVLDCSEDAFRSNLLRENHTLKRALTDPRLFSGIGNTYSDEILHHARLSPLTLTTRLSKEETTRLFDSVRTVMNEWIRRLSEETGEKFPERVTAFRKEMAVHGKFRQPCPRCGAKVQRIVYAENECHYCPACQTEGKVLADRSLSRLLKDDWPKRVEDLET